MFPESLGKLLKSLFRVSLKIQSDSQFYQDSLENYTLKYQFVVRFYNNILDNVRNLKKCAVFFANIFNYLFVFCNNIL